MKKILLLIMILMLSLTTVLANDCAVMSMHGFIPDGDCDGIPNTNDNCPYTPNTDQLDHNMNGLGDSCDLAIDNLVVSPTTWIRANEFISLNMILTNYNPGPITNMHVKVFNPELKIKSETSIAIMGGGQSDNLEFTLKVPECAAQKTYTLAIDTSYKFNNKFYEEHYEQPVKVVPGGNCDGKNTAMDNTIVELLTKQQIDVGQKLTIPIKLTNMNENAESYKLSIEGVTGLGTYRIDPEAEFSIAAGHETTKYAYINLEQVSAGKYPITLNINEESIPITITIRQPITKSQNEILKRALEVTIIIVLLALLIAGSIIAYKKVNEVEE